MCGIAGVVSPHIERDNLYRIICCMGLWQFHRGPDEWGQWVHNGIALGHNRLSILDIEGGQQPMSSGDGNIQVVFNGEIYNFKAIRKDLIAKGYNFKTDHSDTEVIVHGYAEWGVNVFERLEGMFAIAIWDNIRQQLVLARDRIGIKPLYYSQLPIGGLVFASELKAILASGLVKPTVRATSIVDYFMFRAPRHPHTLFENISKLSAGCFCIYKPAWGLQPAISFWSPHRIKSISDNLDKTEEEIIEHLDSAVLSHTISDVPIGIFLSGGVDSSLIAVLLSRHIKLDAFTIGTYSPLDEIPYAQKIADHVGLPLHTRRITAKDFLNRFDDWMYFNDDPVSDPSALALMILAEYAREYGMKVMLAGEGADELFGGYNSYLRYAAFLGLAKIPFAASIGKLVAEHCTTRNRDYLKTLDNLHFMGTGHITNFINLKSLLNPALHDAIKQMQQTAFLQPVQGVGEIRQAMIFDQLVRLPNDLLTRTDRATMAFSLETRVPFLCHHVIELANSLPDHWCINPFNFTRKWLLKRILAKFVPKKLVYRRKRGFDLPLSDWLAKDFQGAVRDYLSEQVIPYIDYEFIRHIYRAHTGEDYSQTPLIWSWLVLEKWYRLWILGQAQLRQPKIISNNLAYDQLLLKC